MKIKKLNEEKNIKNVQNHKGSLSSIISEHSKEITDMTNKYVKASELYSKVKQWVDEAELTGKNAEYAKEALAKMSRMNLENLVTYLFNIRLKGEDSKLGSYDAQMKKRKYESLKNDIIVNEYGTMIETSKGKVFLDGKYLDGVLDPNIGFEFNTNNNKVYFYTLDKGTTIKVVDVDSFKNASEAIKNVINSGILDKYNKIDESLNESVEKTFAQWFDETQSHKDKKYYPFDNYAKTFENAEVLRNATAKDILNNAHRFYNVYDVDSVDREHAFTFASDKLGIDYDVFYNAWLSGKPIDSQQDETLPKNVQKLVLSYLKTANSLLRESTIDLVTKQQLNNVIDMFDSLRNKI